MVDYCLLSIFGVDTQFRHREAVKYFVFFLVLDALLRCRVVAKQKMCVVPSSEQITEAQDLSLL